MGSCCIFYVKNIHTIYFIVHLCSTKQRFATIKRCLLFPNSKPSNTVPDHFRSVQFGFRNQAKQTREKKKKKKKETDGFGSVKIDKKHRVRHG